MPSNGENPRLGPLETELLHALWMRESATVRELMDSGLPGAYTTIMTTLDRLHSKGLLQREQEGRAFRYRAAMSRSEFDGKHVRSALQRLLDGIKPQQVPLSFLVDALGEHDAELLDRLEKEIERKRQELKGARK